MIKTDYISKRADSSPSLLPSLQLRLFYATCQLCPVLQNTPHICCLCPSDPHAYRASLLFYKRAGGQVGQGRLSRFLTAAPQLAACPLTQFYAEWCCNCKLSEWMDRTLRLGFSLEFYSVPSPFRNRFPHCRDLGPTAQTTAQQGKGVLLRLLAGSQEDRGVKTQFGSVPLKQVHCLQHVSHANHQAVAGTGLAGRLTTIDLNDTYFHVEVAPKLRKFLHFAFRWVAYEYNRLPFGYSLALRTLSKCVDMVSLCTTRA